MISYHYPDYFCRLSYHYECKIYVYDDMAQITQEGLIFLHNKQEAVREITI